MRRVCIHSLVLLIAVLVPAVPAVALDILPSGVSYDPDVPTPAEVLGQEVARWHLRHDQLVRYMEVLAEHSDRVTVETQGRTHEGRRQLIVIITSPGNHARLDTIRAEHVALSAGDGPAPSAAELESMPAVVFLGYSIHGNEASGSNASSLVAYHLAAGQGDAIESLLEETVVLLDPSLNPDGMGRFAQWANMHRGETPIGDSMHREHQEVWPGGRTNHYWFDLNRDWLLLQHPESRARVKTFHHWKPNLLGDYHEMGSDSTYFFQPGVPSREHPLKPQGNLELTRAIAAFHARNLGGDGQLFYSEESFDDFYPGKGSTYPDLNGSVGVLFEQASARGHLRETVNGDLEFARAVKNHFLTSLSMLDGASVNRTELLRYQADFPRQSLEAARRDPVGGWVFSCPRDTYRCGHMIEILLGHQVEVHALARGIEADGMSFDPAWSWFVPTDQIQYRLVRALFQRQTEFEDSTFYDISTWTFPLAFGAHAAEVGRRDLGGVAGARLTEAAFPGGRFAADPEAYAYAFSWDGYYAPRALHRLQSAGFLPRVATRRFQAETPDGPWDFDYGTMIVPVAGQDTDSDLSEVLRMIARDDGLDVRSIRSGLTASGVDLGSPNVLPLAPVKVMLLVGDGVSSYEAGEVWHLLDQRFGIPVTMIELQGLGLADLGEYTHVLMVNGSYGDLDESVVDRLEEWVEAGGVLVASKAAATWAEEKILAEEGEAGADAAESELAGEEVERRYVDYEQDRAVELVSGAIFEVELDTTHPLAFGYSDERLPVFRNSTLQLEAPENPYEVVARYSQDPYLSGYISDRQLAELGGVAAVIATRRGSGTVVRMVDNPNFRAFWYGTSKLYLNAIFLGPVVKYTSAPTSW